MNRLKICAAIALLLMACGGAHRATQAPARSLVGEAAEMWVRSESLLPIYPHEGRYYLLGRAGQRYEICLGNRLGGRIEAVVSVDGRDVVTGHTADYRQDRGYVLLAGEQVCIEGFRQSLDQVAAFEFTEREASYAARMGDDSNVGVIGVALFDEDPGAPPAAIAGAEEGAAAPPPEARDRSAAREVAGEEGADEERAIGTAYGGAVSSEAEIVPFKRRSPETPLEVIALFYNDREGLEEMGIDVASDGYATEPQPSPNPFPGAKDPAVYAPPPPASP